MSRNGQRKWNKWRVSLCSGSVARSLAAESVVMVCEGLKFPIYEDELVRRENVILRRLVNKLAPLVLVICCGMLAGCTEPKSIVHVQPPSVIMPAFKVSAAQPAAAARVWPVHPHAYGATFAPSLRRPVGIENMLVTNLTVTLLIAVSNEQPSGPIPLPPMTGIELVWEPPNWIPVYEVSVQATQDQLRWVALNCQRLAWGKFSVVDTNNWPWAGYRVAEQIWLPKIPTGVAVDYEPGAGYAITNAQGYWKGN